MDLKVDPDGLRADGAALAHSASQGGTVAPCAAAASDTVSTHLADMLTTWTQSLHTLLDHAGQLRVAGGLALSGTATDLQSMDDTNAHHISNVINGAGSVPASTPSAPAASPPIIPAPTLPTLPTLNPLAPMTGEQVSALVHAGPGPASLRAFATHIRTMVAPAVITTAQDVRNSGQSVHNHWDDGKTTAAQKVGAHADWLESTLHPSFMSVAAAADSAAEHTDTLIKNTPTPQEFTDLHQRLNVAMANYRATGGRNAAQVASLQSDLAKKQSTALASYETFAAAAPATTAGAAPPAPAPPIVHAGGQVEKLNQTAHLKQDGPGHGQAQHGHGPGDEDSPAPTNAPPGTPTGSPPAAAPLAAAAADQAAPGMVANIAGMIMGAGTGAAGQVAGSLHGLTSSPMSALSSLSSLPGLGGMPQMEPPQLPGGPGDGNGGSPEGGPSDFGTEGTGPASDGGGGGGGGAPPSRPSPAVGPPVGSGITAGTPGGGSTSGGGPGAGGMGMMPPMMGSGMGGKNEEGRKSDDHRRVVLRPVANTEPVFGEVRRERRERTERDKKKT
ncbi:hypothetical protein [Mycolicibacterium llatzerense]|uniref:hypothetical protein n=1 Tax=Mycolicibacterium llatzerense TaxID=280871 RepID=UPI0021B52B58|nr:hypothetical protein [Mycolicibacterium llatzerense]MCT7367353.1 hypothetical protein [Mycolicibacterium llatzerense]